MISDEAKNLFEQLNSGKLEVTDWREYCNSIKLTDKALLQFLMDDSIKEKNIKTFEKQLKESQNSVSSFSSFTQKAGNALAGLGASFAAVGTKMAAGELISLAISTIHNLATEMSQTEEKANGFSQSISTFGTEVSGGQKNIDDLASQYEALSSGVDNTGHSISLSEEKYSKYKNVIQQLSELMPNLSTIFNKQGEAIGFAGGKIDNVKKKYLEYIQLQSKKYLSDGDEDGNTYQDVLDNYHNKTEKTENTWAGIGRGVLDGVVETITLGGMTSHDWGYDTSAELTTEGKIEALERFIELTDQLNQKKIGQLSVNPLERVNNDYVEDILGIDLSDISNLNSDEFDTFVQSVHTKIESLKQEQQVAFSDIQHGFPHMLNSNSEYLFMDDGDKKENISSFVQSMSSDFFKEAGVDLQNQNSIQTFINQIISKFASNKGGVNEAYKDLLSIDTSTLSIDEANKKVNNFCLRIAKAFNMNESAVPILQKMFGFDDFDNANMQPLIDNVKAKVKDGFQDRVGELTLDELKIAADLDVQEGSLLSLDELKAKINEIKNLSGTNSFSTSWESIGTTGNDKTKEEASAAKEKLLELAKAGKLTKEEFQKSPIADQFLKDTKLSAEEATQEINGLISSTEQLSSMKSGMFSITSILNQKQENLSSKETHDKGIGADILAGMPDDVKAQTKEYEHFVNVLGNGKSKMSACKDAANQLATAYINSNNFLANLTDGTEGYYTSVLEEMGIENAAAIVRQSLNEKKANEALLGWDIVNATDKEIAAKANEINAIAGSSEALKQYIFQKALAGKDALKTSGSIRNLIALAKQCGVTGEAIDLMTSMEANMEQVEYYTKGKGKNDPHAGEIISNAKSDIKGAEKRLKKLANKKLKIKVGEINTGNEGKTRTTSNNNNSGSAKQKETKQTIDWIERRLSNLQKVIDLTATKFQNLFSVKDKKKNLDKQIKTTKQLIKEYGLAADKYQKKANKVAAGKKVKGKNGKKKVKNKLSKSIIKKVKTGKLTKKTKPSSLIKAYGSEKAEQIQSYIDYNDKAQSAKKSKVEQITKQRELEQQKLQLDVDLYNERISRAEAKEAIAIGAKQKNASVNKQIKNIQLSYNKQIAIAALTKGAKSKAEIDRLNYEKQKKITDLKVHQIDNIKKDYENKISPFDNAKQKTQNEVSLLEAKGRIVTANYYRKQNDQETNKRNTLQNELKELQGKLKSGTFTEYSDEWYQLQSDIQSVENSINECNVNIVENSKKLGELHNAMLEDIAANNTRMSSEADFLAGLIGSVLTDENGNGLTKEGMGVLGTYGIGMEAAEKNAKDSADERKRLENLLSSHSYGRTNDEYQSEKSLRDKIAEVAQKQQEYTKTAYDYETKIADLMKENYQAQLDYMKKIIDAKKNVLSLEKDLYDYERNISDQTKNIAATYFNY